MGILLSKRIRSFQLCLKWVAAVFLALLTLGDLSAAADSKPHKITAMDRNRVQIDSAEWVELAGINRLNLTNRKKSQAVFSAEMDSFLKAYLGKSVTLEEEKQPRIGARGKAVYLYYLTPAGAFSASGQAPAAKPVLVLDKISGKKGRLKADVKPHMKVMINLEILGKGYARVSAEQNFKYKKEFLLAEKEAQIDGLGIWG